METGTSVHFYILESFAILDSRISVNDNGQLWFSRENGKNQRDAEFNSE